MNNMNFEKIDRFLLPLNHFITTLAYESENPIIHAKMGILAASLLAGIVGDVLLQKSLPPIQP